MKSILTKYAWQMWWYSNKEWLATFLISLCFFPPHNGSKNLSYQIYFSMVTHKLCLFFALKHSFLTIQDKKLTWKSVTWMRRYERKGKFKSYYLRHSLDKSDNLFTRNSISLYLCFCSKSATSRFLSTFQ